jgi:phage terminase small subunit
MIKKQRVFIEQYLQCWNATEAARRAGYAEKYLHTNASKLLQNTTIKAEIERRIAEMTMSADEVLVRLAQQAKGDLADFAGVGNLDDLKDNERSHLVKKIKNIIRTAGGETYATVEIELYSAQAALVHIGKHHGLFAEFHDHSGKVDIVEMTLEEWQAQQAEKRQQAEETLDDFGDPDE